MEDSRVMVGERMLFFTAHAYNEFHSGTKVRIE